MVRTTTPPKRKKAPPKGSNGNGGKGGRPTKFDAEKQRLVSIGARQGFTNAELAELLDVTEQTLLNWRKRYPKFFDALKEGKDYWDDQVEVALRHRAMGYSHPEEKIFCLKDGTVITWETTKHYPPDPVAGIFWLCNRRPDKWKRNLEPKAEGDRDVDWNNVGFRAAAQVDIFTDSPPDANSVKG